MIEGYDDEQNVQFPGGNGKYNLRQISLLQIVAKWVKAWNQRFCIVGHDAHKSMTVARKIESIANE